MANGIIQKYDETKITSKNVVSLIDIVKNQANRTTCWYDTNPASNLSEWPTGEDITNHLVIMVMKIEIIAQVIIFGIMPNATPKTKRAYVVQSSGGGWNIFWQASH